MEELLEALLGIIVEILGEALIELVFGLLVDVGVRSTRGILVGLRRRNPLITTLTLVVLGFVAGALSVFVFPHPLFHPSRMHGVSLLISPLATGLVMAQIGRAVTRRGKKSVQIESFGYGFVFAFAVAVVRLLFVR